MPPYGILLRAIDVNALFIGVRKSRFCKSTLQRKVFAGFQALRYQFHQLIRRQRQHAEHQVRHHFGRTSHPHVPPSKLVLQSPVDPLHHGSLLVSLLLGPTQFPFHLAHRNVLGLALRSARRFQIHDGHVSQAAARLLDMVRLIGRIHQFIAVGDALCTHGGQRNGYLRIMHRGRRQHGTDGDLTIGHIPMEFVPAPVMIVPWLSFFGDYVLDKDQPFEPE